MSDRTPTRFNRLQVGDTVSTPQTGDLESFGEVVASQQVTIAAANSAGGTPATFTITGQFEVDKVKVAYSSALTTTSALAVRVGTSADVTAFADFTVSAGASNGVQVLTTPATGNPANAWNSTGSAAAVTTVQVVHSAASVRADLSAQVTFNYIVRG